MAGMIPFIGFIGKETIYEASLGVVTEPLVVTTAAFLANANMVAAAGLIAIAPFFGARVDTPKPAADPGIALWIGPAVLALLGLLFGLVPHLIDGIVTAVLRSIVPGEKATHLALWHGVNAPLILSLATFALGFLLYFGRKQISSSLRSSNFEDWLEADEIYEHLVEAFNTSAEWLMYRVQGGRMTIYLRTAFVTLTLLVWLTHIFSGDPFTVPIPEVPLIPLAVAGLIIGSSFVVLITGSRLYGLTALGITGSGIAILFVFYSAIDVAITQLLVEMLVVIILAVALVRLPTMPREQSFRALDALIATGLGIGVALVVASVLIHPFDPRISEFYEAASYPKAFGRNVVNVILVDFRALDTLGEVAVVMIASISAAAALTAGGLKVTRRRGS
jgi:multicomponent Na+:H+ antiporter subunit A